MRIKLDLDIRPQPNEETCGPTCLHAVYRFYNDDISLEKVIEEVPRLHTGGTLAVLLACHALKRGYQATVYTYNLQLFDPTWFRPEGPDLRARLKAQRKHKKAAKLGVATDAYLEFLDLGGDLKSEDLTSGLIRKYLNRSVPILTGLSATYLYQCAREHGPKMDYDDVRGVPTGHFVLLSGYDKEERTVRIADPLHTNPLNRKQKYEVGISRVINAILLGIVTYDANLLIIRPQGKQD